MVERKPMQRMQPGIGKWRTLRRKWQTLRSSFKGARVSTKASIRTMVASVRIREALIRIMEAEEEEVQAEAIGLMEDKMPVMLVTSPGLSCKKLVVILIVVILVMVHVISSTGVARLLDLDTCVGETMRFSSMEQCDFYDV